MAYRLEKTHHKVFEFNQSDKSNDKDDLYKYIERYVPNTPIRILIS